MKRIGVISAWLVVGLFALGWTGLAEGSWWDWALGLEGGGDGGETGGVSVGDENVELTWRYPLPGWLWVLIGLGALGLAWASYTRMVGPRWGRYGLAGLRAMLLVWVAILLAGPGLVRTDERVEKDRLLILVDRSASMQTRDMAGAGGAESRDERLRSAVKSQAAVFGPERLGADRELVWLGFDVGAYPIEGVEGVPADDNAAEAASPEAGVVLDWDAAEGGVTRVRTAIEQALQSAAGRPISGVVVMSDGRSPEATPAGFVEGLKERGVRVFGVALGSDELPLDLAVESVTTPGRAFVGDVVPVVVQLEQLGVLPGDGRGIDPARVEVQLVDPQADGAEEVLQSVSLAGGRLDEPVRLEAVSEAVGEVDWQVRVVVDGVAVALEAVEVEGGGEGGGVEGEGESVEGGGRTVTDRGLRGGVESEELTLANNVGAVDLTLTDEPIRVLYIEGYPRWEYRYLVSMLKREESINSSVLLRTAGSTFVQEGDTPIVRAPVTADEIKPYDVIILGDVGSDYLSEGQMRLIAEHVAGSKAGLLWIGGPQHTPGGWVDTPLRALLPMREPAMVGRLRYDRGDGRGLREDVRMLPTEEARRLNVLQLMPPGVDREGGVVGEGQAWPGVLPELYWAQNLGRLMPTAEALAVAEGVALSGGDGERGPTDSVRGLQGVEGGAPLMVRMRFGSGEVVYSATDDTWRYRLELGEHYFEQLWIQVVRMLARQRIATGGAGASARLEVLPERLSPGQTAVVRLTVDDGALAGRLPRVVRAVVRREAVGGRNNAAQAASPLGEVLEVVELRRVPEGSTPGARPTLEAVWRPGVVGRLRLTVEGSGVTGLDGASGVAVVVDQDDERRRPEADPARLVRLAEGTDGAMVALDDLKALERLVPKLSRSVAVRVEESIWDSWLGLMVFVGLITLEWLGRKAMQLV
ncbi:MAG: vWA domain-containing protein [Planctomycetota bacterium]